MPLSKYSRNSEGQYGPTTRGDFYISKEDHRRTAKFKKEKTRWTIAEGEEFSVFKLANEEYDTWFCTTNNCIFSLVDNADVELGKGGERIAKFPNERNLNEPWHGYPVATEESQNRPSTELLDRLIKKKYITLPIRIRIEKGIL